MSHGLSDLSLARLSGTLFSVDIAAAVLSTLAIDVLTLAVLAPDEPLRLLVGLPLLFVLPGYTLVAALFPARASRTDVLDDATTRHRTSRLRQRGIDGVERAALSVGVGAAVLPVVGLALSLVPGGLSPTPVVVTLSGVVFVAAAATVMRRARLPADRRFTVSLRTVVGGTVGVLPGVTRSETLVNLGLAASVVVAAVALGYAVAAPQPTGTHAELAVLTESPSGDLVAADYPDRLDGDGAFVVRVENAGGTTQTYTVVAQLERVAADGSVTERRRLTTFEPTLEPGEQWTTRHRPDPTASGTDHRLTYLLYRGDPPANPTRENAYREIFVWVDA